MTFSKAYAPYCPDVEKIAEAMGIKPHTLIGSSTPQLTSDTRRASSGV
ncbi:hypothetical protein FHT86_000863 [Rhizobium sp. BK313]|nr:hypothetical protein [Rhizobium sp. BK313]MBB3452607.1 hypothetical protein [Rhizobium sp. BK313]